jgi:MOSC domain-containing protein YiiM
MSSLAQSGLITAISTSATKGVKKNNVESALFIENHGIAGDAHAANWHRQVSLLAHESIDKMIKAGLSHLHSGDFAENITTTGIELVSLPVGTQVLLGENVLLEITQIGKECHTRCAIYYAAGDCVMPKEGVFAKVMKGGTVNTGASIRVVE